MRFCSGADPGQNVPHECTQYPHRNKVPGNCFGSDPIHEGAGFSDRKCLRLFFVFAKNEDFACRLPLAFAKNEKKVGRCNKAEEEGAEYNT